MFNKELENYSYDILLLIRYKSCYSKTMNNNHKNKNKVRR